MQAVFGHEGQAAKAARVERWRAGITTLYPDGTESCVGASPALCQLGAGPRTVDGPAERESYRVGPKVASWPNFLTDISH
jgi:hypothetical protein